MVNPLDGKRITLGVTGSIAAYKAADLASRLTKQGAIVHAVLTEAAEKFVSPLTFQTVSGQKAYTEADLWSGEGHVVHIYLGRNSDVLLIAPASANTIAKLALGIADNLLCVTVLAADCPIIVAPAMDGGMYANTATQANIQILKDRGVQFVGPAAGHLASGLVGSGRMEDPQTIVDHLRLMFSRSNPLAGKKVVVTAGGTQEAIDPVRMISNHSSGKQGYALAQAALDAGADVTLISAPTSLSVPLGCNAIQVTSAEDMLEAVLSEVKDAHALIMAAAVADFTPTKTEKEKIKKDQKLSEIKLTTTKDILKEVSALKKKQSMDLKIIGFAAESQSLKENAQKKLREKGMDMIVANDITNPQAGFGVDTNLVLLFFSDGSFEKLPLLSKGEVAEKIIQHLINWMKEGTG
jgi:phosphopantothenoylcysteine decarboxylase / phosphopantothenate---cysteine ligase